MRPLLQVYCTQQDFWHSYHLRTACNEAARTRLPAGGALARTCKDILVQPEPEWARGEREGYGGPRDVTSLSLSLWEAPWLRLSCGDLGQCKALLILARGGGERRRRAAARRACERASERGLTR